MWFKHLTRFWTILGLVGALGFIAAPAAQAQGGHVALHPVVPAPQPHIQTQVATSVADHLSSERPVQAQDGRAHQDPPRADPRGNAGNGSIAALQAAVVPSLAAVFPTVDFADSPPQFEAIGPNAYAAVSPQLFWGPDQAAAAQAAAVQLAQHTPGWSTALLNGPEGYGYYLVKSV
jgi:hypothetical protein